ncbi:hypothetical protein GGR52DRAFT_294987 [Hypoxylon sp. FL1284]|nr:hypothetical protein GGR52DRAFT_294987 [Hypoxylon sp. FL1284]
MVKKSSGARPPRPGSSRTATPTHLSSKSGAGTGNADAGATDPALSVPQQQRVLNVFRDAFREVLEREEDFGAALQEVKGALYRRDFAAAFGAEHLLEVYAARYSPPRALCYAAVLARISDRLAAITAAPSSRSGAAYEEEDDEVERGRASPTVDGADEEAETVQAPTLKIIAIGGGAAEIAAFGAFLGGSGAGWTGDLTLVDSGPWGTVVEKLRTALTTPPPVSRYASAAAKAADTAKALVEPAGRLRSAFVQADALELGRDGRLAGLLGPDPLLVTLLFTLNELYTTGGVGRTTAFLRGLTAAVPAGSLLLVVDSPGSYSEAAVGKEARRYPMQWLLDHTLLEAADKLPPDGCAWEKLESHDSVWFRHPPGLRYSIELEDMRYQMHLYRARRRVSD